MSRIELPLSKSTNDHNQDEKSIVSADNHLGRCPQNVLETIYSYLDCGSLLTFRLVQKMSPAQQLQYSSILNRFYQVKVERDLKPHPSPYQIFQYAWSLVYEMLGFDITHFPFQAAPIFSAFDTIHLPKDLQTLANVNELATFSAKEKRPLKGLNLIASIETDHLNSLINDLLSPEADHPMAKALPGIEHLYLRANKKIDNLPALLKKTAPLKTFVLYDYLPINALLTTFTDAELNERFHALQILALPDTKITTKQLARLLKAIDGPLTKLDLWKFKDQGLTHLTLSKKEIGRIFGSMTDLNLGSSTFDARALAIILKKCRSLRQLSLQDCGHTIGLFYELRKKGLNKEIDFSLSQSHLPGSFGEELKALQNKHKEKLRIIFGAIHTLYLDNSALNHHDLEGLLSSCHSLVYLNLNGCVHISQAIESMSVEAIQNAFSRLETLNLWDSKITVAALLSILKVSHSLKNLILADCTSITELIESQTPEELEILFGHIATLDLHRTKLTQEAAQKLMVVAPHLKNGVEQGLKRGL